MCCLQGILISVGGRKLIWTEYNWLLRLPLSKISCCRQVGGVQAESLEYFWFGPVQKFMVLPGEDVIRPPP